MGSGLASCARSRRICALSRNAGRLHMTGRARASHDLAPGSRIFARALRSPVRDTRPRIVHYLVSRASAAKRNETRDPAQKARSATLAAPVRLKCDSPARNGRGQMRHRPGRQARPAKPPVDNASLTSAPAVNSISGVMRRECRRDEDAGCLLYTSPSPRD